MSCVPLLPFFLPLTKHDVRNWALIIGAKEIAKHSFPVFKDFEPHDGSWFKFNHGDHGCGISLSLPIIPLFEALPLLEPTIPPLLFKQVRG